MKPFLYALAVCALSAGPVLAGSPAELVQKQKAYADAVKAALARDPAGDSARQEKMRGVVTRYGELAKSSNNGSYLIDLLCRENDELFAIYK